MLPYSLMVCFFNFKYIAKRLWFLAFIVFPLTILFANPNMDVPKKQYTETENGLYEAVHQNHQKFTRSLSGPTTASKGLSEYTIRICDDGAEWPPYSYYSKNKSAKYNQVVGYSIDVINDIFSKHNIRYTATLIPWARCLYEVKRGKKYHMLLSSASSTKRAVDYLMSDAYYTVQPYYMYSTKHHPHGLDINNSSDLKKYKAGGIFNYDYSHFGYNENNVGFKSGQITTTSKSYEQAIQLLLVNRFALCPIRLEIFLGYKLTGKDFSTINGLSYKPIPNLAPETCHMLVSKNFAHGTELRKLLNAGIKRLKKSGQLKQFLSKYISTDHLTK